LIPYSKKTNIQIRTGWLTNSGCSTHINPHANDIIGDKASNNIAVEVTNGILVPSKSVGTVRICIHNIYTDEKFNVFLLDVLRVLLDVLRVPGLNCCLLSIKQWREGGDDT
jgi:hypothetical protein